MTIFRLILTALIVLSPSAWAHPLSPEDPPFCRCHSEESASSWDENGHPYGRFISSIGDVEFQDVRGPGKADTARAFYGETQITVGVKSSATITVGQYCRLEIDERTIVHITREPIIDDKLCVRTDRLQPATIGGIPLGAAAAGVIIVGPGGIPVSD